MTTWRKIRDASAMNKISTHRTANIHGVCELAAWPDMWVLRGGSSVRGHVVYGLDIQANRLVWSLTQVGPPEGLGWGYDRTPLLTQTEDFAIVATYIGRNRERVWLLALEPHTGELVWRKPVAWARRSGKTIYNHPYIGLTTTGAHLIVMENRAMYTKGTQGEDARLLWLDPATGETIHECVTPLSENPAGIAGGHLYFHGMRGEGRGLYRVPTAPGAESAEQILDTFVPSIKTEGDHLYVAHSTEDEEEWEFLDWTFAHWDTRESGADPLGKPATCIRHWDNDRNWPRLMAANPAQPGHIIAHRDTALWGMDIHTGETLWEHTFKYSTNIKQVLHTSHGTLLNGGNGVEGLDLLTGTRTDLGIDGVVENVVAAGDTALIGHTFNTGGHLYVAENTPSAVLHPDPVTGDETWTVIKLRDLLPDLLTDPRDELQVAFTKASGRGSLNTLFKTVRQITKTSQTHQQVKAYLKALKAGELDTGPLNFTPLNALSAGCFFYPDLFSFGPEEHFFPGMLFASETYGIEFYVMLETGKVISLHHDATFFEVASDVWHECDGAVGVFEKRFPQEGALLDISQLVQFQQAFPDCPRVQNLGDLDPRDFFTRTAQALGWTLTQFRARIEDTRLEFLYHYYRDHDDVLDAMIKEVEQQVMRNA